MTTTNIVLNVDCIKYMGTVPDNFFHLAIIDPPYGIGQSGNKNISRGHLTKPRRYKPYYGNDQSPPPSNFFAELKRISKNQIIFGANHFIANLPFPVNSPCWLVWDKCNSGTDFADCELAWASFSTAVRLFSFRWNGMLQENMKNKEIRIHPNQKPVALYGWILKNYSHEGDKIFDSHVGSGVAGSQLTNYNVVFGEVR